MKNILNAQIDITRLPKASGFQRLIQSIDFDILVEIDRICKKHNISYWLDFGTLLGAIRHKGFIPWDDDLDISMMYEDYLKFQSVVEDELKDTNYIFVKVPSNIGKILCKDFYPDTDEKMQNFINWTEKENLYIAVDIYPYHFIKDELGDNISKDLENARYNKIKLYEKYNNIQEWNYIQDFVDDINYKYSTNKKSSKVYRGIEAIGSCLRMCNYDDIFPLQKVEFEEKYFSAPNNYKKLLLMYYDDYMKPCISHYHLDLKNICKNDKLKLLQYKTIEEKYK